MRNPALEAEGGRYPCADTIIAGIPAVDYLSLLQSHLPDPMQRFAEQRGFDTERIERVLRVVSPLAMKPQVDRERLFLFAGRADRLASPEQAQALWRHWDRPRLGWYDGSHISFMWENAVERLVVEALGSTGFLEHARGRPALAPVAGA